MTIRYVDRFRPHVDDTDLLCPGCGQSYNVIAAGFTLLPDRHYRQPVNTNSRTGVVGTANSSGWHIDQLLCLMTGDDLVAHLFRVQLAAEQQQTELARRGVA